MNLSLPLLLLGLGIKQIPGCQSIMSTISVLSTETTELGQCTLSLNIFLPWMQVFQDTPGPQFKSVSPPGKILAKVLRVGTERGLSQLVLLRLQRTPNVLFQRSPSIRRTHPSIELCCGLCHPSHSKGLGAENQSPSESCCHCSHRCLCPVGSFSDNVNKKSHGLFVRFSVLSESVHS